MYGASWMKREDGNNLWLKSGRKKLFCTRSYCRWTEEEFAVHDDGADGRTSRSTIGSCRYDKQQGAAVGVRESNSVSRIPRAEKLPGTCYTYIVCNMYTYIISVGTCENVRFGLCLRWLYNTHVRYYTITNRLNSDGTRTELANKTIGVRQIFKPFTYIGTLCPFLLRA